MVGRVLLMLATLLLAGCLEGAAVDEGEVSDDVAVELADPLATEFSWASQIGTWVVGCSSGTCYGTGVGPAVGAADNTEKLRRIVGADLALSWDTPNSLAFGLAQGCDDACDYLAWDSGMSPLSIHMADLDAEATYTLVVWHPYNDVAGGVGTQGGAQTAFEVDGALLVPAA